MQGGSPAQNDGQVLAAKTIKYEELVNFKKQQQKTQQNKNKNNQKVQVVVSRQCSCTTLELKSLRPLPAWVEEWCAWYFYIRLYTAHRK